VYVTQTLLFKISMHIIFII